MRVELERVRAYGQGTPALWLVKRGDKVIGMLEKYKDTRTEKHPWKAFHGVGMENRFLRTFYPNEGGQDAAIEAIKTAQAAIDEAYAGV